MNKVIMMGRLTRDPEVRYTTGEKSMCVARFSIAVDRRGKQKEGAPEADFFNCTSFGRQGEFVEKYLKKGTKILISGRLQNNNYTNRDGQKVYAIEIFVEEIEFAESKREETPATTPAAASAAPASNADGFFPVEDAEDLPLPFHF